MADPYAFSLDRTHAAACRLNLQYYLWKETLAFDIAPSIPLPPQNGDSVIIADIACGTAIWLLHVARSLPPNAVIEGFDIDLSRAPAQELLPQNVHLAEWNIFDEVPERMVGRYDYVHVRLLILVIERTDMRSIIGKFHRLLKPGGYLQWDELDTVNMCVKKPSDAAATPTPALDGLRDLCHSGGRYDWGVDIARVLAEGGFREPKMMYFGDGREMERAFNDQHMLTMEEFAMVLQKAGQEVQALHIHRLIKEAFREATMGAALCIPRLVCTAQK